VAGYPDQQALPEAVTVVAFVRQQRLGRGDRDPDQWLSSGVIGGLAASQGEAERRLLIFAAGMDFARKAAA
jgi:hypothetical protein